MSLLRLVYYSAMISAWAAFLGWGVAEIARVLTDVDPGTTSKWTVVLLGFINVAVTSATIGATIGLGLNVLGGMANGRWRELSRRALPGLLGGSIGGVAGGMVGELMFYGGLSRAIGWTVLGLGVGVVEGVYDRSFRKIRNGLIGGAIGGLVGGLLFDWICTLELDGLRPIESGSRLRGVGTFHRDGHRIGPLRFSRGVGHGGRWFPHRPAIEPHAARHQAGPGRPSAIALLGAG